MTLPANLKMFYKREGTIIQYTISTDPEEAMYWSTYRLKKGDISLHIKLDRSLKAQIKEEILHDILSREPNPSSKSQTTEDKIQKRSKSTQPIYVETRKTKQKTRR